MVQLMLMDMKSLKSNERGVISHIMLGLLFVIVIGAIVAGFLYVRKQNQDNTKKDQAIQAANSQIEALKGKTSIPQDWKPFPIGDGQKAVLPNYYKLDQEINGTFLFSDPDGHYDDNFSPKIAVHQHSLPSINYKTFSYDTYCQFNGTAWVAYTNASNTQTADKSAAAVSACAKITAESIDGIKYYAFENTDGYNYHAAYAVKAGSNYYVLSYEKYFNGYGSEAIDAAATGVKKSMLITLEKIVSANQ